METKNENNKIDEKINLVKNRNNHIFTKKKRKEYYKYFITSKIAFSFILSIIVKYIIYNFIRFFILEKVEFIKVIENNGLI